ncbi:MAG: hypothetical protein B7Z37_30130 [Verrucomicrobia bacterium 12-59-8]|nr:MAG: hypothetical protein B7Z37_30130 [Verrucomicrobia bacterium 12-59-8]
MGPPSMNTQSLHTPPSSVLLRAAPRHRSSPAFTLVEVIIVVALISMIFIMAVPYTLGALQSASLTSAGDTLMQKLAQAQQRASTENRPIALDFYYYERDGIPGCHAMQMASYDPATNAATPVEPPVYWSEGRAMVIEGELSPMFATNVLPATTGPATLEPFKKLEATFRRVILYPNGSTSLRIPLREAYLTFISTKNYQKDLATPPPNYYTVQIDPVTGRGHSYRP